MYKKVMILYFMILSMFLFTGIFLERFPLDVEAQSFGRTTDPAITSSYYATAQSLSEGQDVMGVKSANPAAEPVMDDAVNADSSTKSLIKIRQD
jgi:hypothetical protein